MGSEVTDLENRLQEAGDDMFELGGIITSFNINTQGRKIKTCEEARALIQKHIDELKIENTRHQECLDRNRNGLKVFLQEEREKQLKCMEFYVEAKRELESLNTVCRYSLQLICKDYAGKISLHSQKAEAGSLRVLVSGEICSGKSSVLNVLMGGEYLAVGYGPCTQIPCEVQHSTELKADLYYADIRFGSRTTAIGLDEKDPVWEQLRNCIENGEDVLLEKEQRTGQKIKKILIHWELPFLKDREEAPLASAENVISTEDQIYQMEFVET